MSRLRKQGKCLEPTPVDTYSLCARGFSNTCWLGNAASLQTADIAFRAQVTYSGLRLSLAARPKAFNPFRIWPGKAQVCFLCEEHSVLVAYASICSSKLRLRGMFTKKTFFGPYRTCTKAKYGVCSNHTPKNNVLTEKISML